MLTTIRHTSSEWSESRNGSMIGGNKDSYKRPSLLRAQKQGWLLLRGEK
jgi:hypothetical protein